MIDFDEKELDLKCSEEEVFVNGDGCEDDINLNGDIGDNWDESYNVKVYNLLFFLNGIICGGD